MNGVTGGDGDDVGAGNDGATLLVEALAELVDDLKCCGS